MLHVKQKKGCATHTHIFTVNLAVICPSLCICNWPVKQVENNLREKCVSLKSLKNKPLLVWL